MRRRRNSMDAPFQTIENTAHLTGLSRDYIRRGVRAGTIPFIRGESENSAYMINLPLFLHQLEEEATANMKMEAKK